MQTLTSQREQGTERRRYPRRHLCLNAELTGRDIGTRACNIRDYCPGGFFLVWDERAAPVQGRRPTPRGEHVTIRFSLETDSGSKKSFGLQGTVARGFAGGVGVALKARELPALRALDQLADRQEQEMRARRGATSGGGYDRARIITQITELVRGQLPSMLESFFTQADERLFACAQEAKSNVEQNEFFDALNEFREHKEQIARGLSNWLPESMEHLGEPAESFEPRFQESDSESLALIAQDDFEDFLAISEMISKAELRYKEILYELERRFSHLVSGTIDKSNNPVGLSAFCHAFADTLHRSTDLKQRTRKTIYDAFVDTALRSLGDIYGEINGVLKKHNVLPVLEHKPGRPREACSTSPDTLRPIDEQMPVEASEPVLMEDNVDSHASAWCQPVEHSGPTLGAGRVSRQAHGPLQSLMSLHRLARHGSPQTSLGVSHASAPAHNGSAHRTPAPDPQAILNALSQLQRQQAPADGLPPGDFNGRLRALLSSQLGGTTPVPERQIESVETVGTMMDGIDGDELISDHLKEQLRRLNIPLCKLAVQDQDFLSAESHPARHVLNQLARLDCSIRETGAEGKAQLRESIEGLIDRLVSGLNNGDPGLLSKLLTELDGLVDDRDRLYTERVERVVKECRDQQAFLMTRRKAAGHSENTADARNSPAAYPADWNVWLERARRLQPGDGIGLRQGSKGQQRAALAWIGEDYNPFVFVDRSGMKVATMTLQELAMQLRRGSAVILEGSERPVMERALLASLYKLHDAISRRALSDPSTGLLNYKRFVQRLEMALRRAQKEGIQHVLLGVDLNCVETLTKRWGADAGQALLKEVGVLVIEHTGDKGVVTQLTDDRLGVLLQGCSGQQGLQFAEELLKRFHQFLFAWKHQKFRLTVAIGLVPIANNDADVAAVLEATEAACEAARHESATRIHLHESHLGEPPADADKLDWRRWIDKTLAEDKVRIFCQPILPLSEGDGARPRYELLSGLRDDEGKVLAPGGILAEPALKDEAQAFDRLLLRAVLRWFADHKKTLANLDGCAISFSEHSLCDDRFLDYVLGQFTDNAVPPGKFCFNIAQSVVTKNLAQAEQFIRTMKEFGCRFAMVNCGSSEYHGYLEKMPVDYLRIDGMFVQNVFDNPDDFALVKSINEIGHLMGKKTIADQADGAAILDKLREIGVDYAQGIEPSRPIDEVS